MTLGPVEYAVIEFPGNRFNGDVVPALSELVESGVIRILDITFVKKDRDGNVEAYELSTLERDEAAAFDELDGEIGGLLSEEDLRLAAADLRPDSSAGVLVWENAWAARFAAAVSGSDGHVLAHERIPAEVVAAAVRATAQGVNQ